MSASKNWAETVPLISGLINLFISTLETSAQDKQTISALQQQIEAQALQIVGLEANEQALDAESAEFLSQIKALAEKAGLATPATEAVETPVEVAPVTETVEVLPTEVVPTEAAEVVETSETVEEGQSDLEALL